MLVIVRAQVLFPSFNGSSSKINCAGDDQDSRGLFRNEISCLNSTTIRRNFPDRKSPTRFTIKRLLDKFKEIG